ncbi:uncharacterized protein L3040_003383 [Drepanopeziza brunnea f. sp. 'multigermtubi']|uniref:Uncharacterized protein n=1 Tax=Marssonina brunnea f. sp. multigermtubi (strain MB_m1) TaxID=1072389 RepID=K1WUC5_MARBU|nr:uncharacterized protein MBM_09682 [Drepanopeziza brunnea f. sp. 'multigermtubi' MB_m1]EKD12183.1 hypothetical protein MBM_09682 [Drepanopeziza brunnea f. sp. 'multigermtubi' MB_m1]KAJ5047560.1 hypothetical protein L3040_003383 [Drepanopeziza brunnea f. sp. 'multigermtubi']
MASMNDPFDDSNENKSLPARLPSLSITPSNPPVGRREISSHLNPAEPQQQQPQNPFRDSEDSPRPSTGEDDVVPRDMPHPDPRAAPAHTHPHMLPGSGVAAATVTSVTTAQGGGNPRTTGGGITIVREFGTTSTTATAKRTGKMKAVARDYCQPGSSRGGADSGTSSSFNTRFAPDHCQPQPSRSRRGVSNRTYSSPFHTRSVCEGDEEVPSSALELLGRSSSPQHTPSGLAVIDYCQPSNSKQGVSNRTYSPSSFNTRAPFVSGRNGKGIATTTTRANPWATTFSPEETRRENEYPLTTMPRAFHAGGVYPSPDVDVDYNFSPVTPTIRMPAAATLAPPLRPAAGRRLAWLSSLTSRLAMRSPSISTSTYALELGMQAREESNRQDDELLEQIRIRASTTFQDKPRLRHSPSVIRVATELIQARDNSKPYGSGAVLHSKAFWLVFALLQAGAISGTAVLAVIIVEETARGEADMNTGRVLWVVISVALIVIGGLGTWLIYLHKKGLSVFGGTRNVRDADEVALLDMAVGQDIPLSDMNQSTPPDLERGNTRRVTVLSGTGRPSLRARGMARMASMNSVVTADPTWQALYSSPQELRTMVSQETIREEPEEGDDTPVRRGEPGNPGRGADVMPGSMDSDAVEDLYSASPVKASKPAAQFKRLDSSWPLRSPPPAQPAPFVKTHPQRIRDLSTPPKRQIQGETEKESPGTPSNHRRRRPTLEVGRGSSPCVQGFSPLTDLSYALTSGEIAALPIRHRPQYIQKQRAESEERIRGVRQSLNHASSSSEQPHSAATLVRMSVPRIEQPSGSSSRPKSTSISEIYTITAAAADDDEDDDKYVLDESESEASVAVAVAVAPTPTNDIVPAADSRPIYKPKIRRNMSLAEFLRADNMTDVVVDNAHRPVLGMGGGMGMGAGAGEEGAKDGTRHAKMSRSRSPGVEHAKKMLASVKEHFTTSTSTEHQQSHGDRKRKKLGSVVRERIGKLKESGVVTEEAEAEGGVVIEAEAEGEGAGGEGEAEGEAEGAAAASL